jgi:hypothetical protein
MPIEPSDLRELAKLHSSLGSRGEKKVGVGPDPYR